MHKADPKIIVALDYPDSAQAMNFVNRVSPELCRLKIGKELFTSSGPQFVSRVVEQGYDVFLDLKFHDIPNTVGKALEAASRLGVWMVNVHALGGMEMMAAAREAIAATSGRRPLLIAVSILTSTDEQGLHRLGIEKSVSQMVRDLTDMSLECGLDGMVCSAREVSAIRSEFGQQPLLVTPGIRPTGDDNHDQKRVMTPQQALASGSSYLVMGRPITGVKDPVARLQEINETLH